MKKTKNDVYSKEDVFDRKKKKVKKGNTREEKNFKKYKKLTDE